MSGGVDSSVAAALLAEQGHDVIGLSMQLYDQSEGQTSFGSCCSIDDLHDARRVAAAINIPHYIVNFEKQFNEQVISNFVSEYTAGRTPLPCAHCNSDLKFATLAERAHGLGADAVATGHYARVDRGERRPPSLRRGVDAAKDQSYFLFSLTQAQLAGALFPVGDLPKDQVRAHARQRRLPVADKPDSQEICFVPDGDYARVRDERARPRRRAPARSSTTAGACWARMPASTASRSASARGSACRSRRTARRRCTCSRCKPDRIAGRGRVEAMRSNARLTASGVNWIAASRPTRCRVSAQIRHRHRRAGRGRPSAGRRARRIEFDEPQRRSRPVRRSCSTTATK